MSAAAGRVAEDGARVVLRGRRGASRRVAAAPARRGGQGAEEDQEEADDHC